MAGLEKLSSLSALPLYAQVKARLVSRIETGKWSPGMAIPNEFALAGELGVSQGTVRKALGEMTAEKLLVRRQGRGTYVAEHTPESMLFRFFNFYDQNENHIAPETVWARVRTAKGTSLECKKLGLKTGSPVVRISRVRSHQAAKFVHEHIVLPEALFPGLADEVTIPNTLYDHFQKSYGITITGGNEHLDAIRAGKREAKWLDVDIGAPLLRLDRLAFSFDQRPIEWRVSLCNLAGAHYLVRLR